MAVTTLGTRFLSMASLSILLSVCGTSRCKKVSGMVRTGPSENWVFLARFCYLAERGSLYFNATYPTDYAVQNIILYFDSMSQWPLVYGPNAKLQECDQKLSILSRVNNQIINLTSSYEFAGCNETSVRGTNYYKCSGGRSFRSKRERWWFIVLSNCASTKGLHLNYSLHMTNGEPGDVFFEELSADEFYIPQIIIAFILAYVLVTATTIYFAVCLKGRQLLHTTYKMFISSVLFETVSLLFSISYYASYARTGIQIQTLRNAGRAFDAISFLVFVLMLILMGKGYTLTRGRISHTGTVKIAVLMTVYTITYIALFSWESVFFDPALVLYLYESPPGYGLIALRLGSWMWFAYTVTFTLKHYPAKRAFYYPFFAFFTIWFWAGPVVVFIAMRVMYPWVREKVVASVELGVVLCGHAVFLILTRPTAANKNFPYHVRTSQIGICNLKPENEEETKDANFVNNPYVVENACFKDLEVTE